MIDMLTRHAIQVLRQAGHEQQDVARLVGVGVRTVRRVEREPDVRHVDDSHERAQRAMRTAFTRGLAEQAIGAEYVAHYLAERVPLPASITGDSPGHPTDRSSVLGPPSPSSLRPASLTLPFDADGGRS